MPGTSPALGCYVSQKWQATWCCEPMSVRLGFSRAQMSWQLDNEFGKHSRKVVASGDGRSPSRTMRCLFFSRSGQGSELLKSRPWCRDVSAQVESSFVSHLHNISEIEYHDAVADMADDGEIVADEEVASPKSCCRS